MPSAQDVAKKCLEDPDYAKTVLESDEYPEVRSALWEDLKADDEVSGFLNPQPLPPGPDDRQLLRDWRVMVAPRWRGIQFLQLRSFIGIGL
jgi:hypothetical protein